MIYHKKSENSEKPLRPVYRDWIKANEVIKIRVSSANRGNQKSTDNDKGSPEELVQQSEARRVNAILLG